MDLDVDQCELAVFNREMDDEETSRDGGIS